MHSISTLSPYSYPTTAARIADSTPVLELCSHEDEYMIVLNLSPWPIVADWIGEPTTDSEPLPFTASACPDCGAPAWEPCYPDCLGEAVQHDIDLTEIERDEDHDPFGDLADRAEDRMFGAGL